MILSADRFFGSERKGLVQKGEVAFLFRAVMKLALQFVIGAIEISALVQLGSEIANRQGKAGALCSEASQTGKGLGKGRDARLNLCQKSGEIGKA